MYTRDFSLPLAIEMYGQPFVFQAVPTCVIIIVEFVESNSVFLISLHVYGKPFSQKALLVWHNTVLSLSQVAQLIMIILLLTALTLC